MRAFYSANIMHFVCGPLHINTIRNNEESRGKQKTAVVSIGTSGA